MSRTLTHHTYTLWHRSIGTRNRNAKKMSNRNAECEEKIEERGNTKVHRNACPSLLYLNLEEKGCVIIENSHEKIKISTYDSKNMSRLGPANFLLLSCVPWGDWLAGVSYPGSVVWSRSRTFWLEPEPVKKLRLRAIAVWPRGAVVAK